MKDLLSHHLNNFLNKRILVIGDLMLDEYVWGRVARISPEAPVPVVEAVKRSYVLGGAANVANNIRALDGEAIMLGIVGDDQAGKKIIQLLEEKGLATDFLIIDSNRPTTLKTRITAQNQQIVRIDCEVREIIHNEVVEKVLQLVDNILSSLDAIILSDYGKGLLSPELLEQVIRRARECHKPILVDPKGTDYYKYKGVTVITPNQHEAETAAAVTIKNEESLRRAANKLLEEVQCSAVLITRGEHGMSLFKDSGETFQVPALDREIYDVTGARDTVISVLSLGLAVGAPIEEAMQLANFGAGVVVQKYGTAIVSRDEISEAINRYIDN